MSDGINTAELDAFTAQLMDMANKKMPTECKKFMRAEGTKLKRVVNRNAKSVNNDKGNYRKSIKRGKVYKYDGAYAIRVFSYDPKAHLIEDGHRIVTRGKGKKAKKHYTTLNGGVEKGFVKGKKVFSNAHREYSTKYVENVEKFVDDFIERGL